MMTAERDRLLRASRRRGMTLVELLVSVAILSMIIMIFSMILSRSQALVSTTEAAIRGNASAAAIGEVIRSDVRRVTQNGFVCITQDPTPVSKGSPLLIMTVAGPTGSVRSPGVDSTAAIVVYGLAPNGVLYRRSLLLTTTAADDSIQGRLPTYAVTSLSGVQTAWTLQSYDSIVDNLVTDVASNALNVPGSVTGLSDLGQSWQIVATNVSELSVQRIGAGNGWYGIWYNPANSKYEARAAGTAPWQGNTTPGGGLGNRGEYDDGSGFYRVIWSKLDQNTWPLAIKVSFVVSDPNLPEQVAGQRYEVVCPVR